MIKTVVGTSILLLGATEIDKRLSISYDVKQLMKVMPVGRQAGNRMSRGETVVDLWNDCWKVRQNQAALIFIKDTARNSETWTYFQLEKYSNQVAHFLSTQSFKKNDTIALFMENRPEFVAIWLGISKAGLRVSLINTAILEKSLFHSLTVVDSKAIIYGAELSASFEGIEQDVARLGMKSWKQGAKDLADSFDKVIASSPTAPPNPKLREGITSNDIFGYIYTSGTTGLPKAALVLHGKMLMSGFFPALASSQPGVDILYCTLPLYHSAGGVLGIGFMLTGVTMVIRRKFSAQNFFQDCAEHNVTIIHYIGELCRYLLANSPESQYHKNHKIRIAFGNGLRPEIWKEFQAKFNIPQIFEFYGATEANGLIYNVTKGDEGVGCVGRLGYFGRRTMGLKIVDFNVENEVLNRDPKTGFCRECGPNEIGQLLIEIKPNNKLSAFPGYSDKKATEKKVAENVFRKGDSYFCSGDLLTCDQSGYFRFVDRIGDTFRWKGENCSTMEVAEVVNKFEGVSEANVYGVLIPNNADGRAPCAAMCCETETFDFKGFLTHLKKNLPSYSIPLFLRILPKMGITETFKHQKVELRNQGIDISKVKDQIFYLQDGKSYVKLDEAIYAKICTPMAKL